MQDEASPLTVCQVREMMTMVECFQGGNYGAGSPEAKREAEPKIAS